MHNLIQLNEKFYKSHVTFTSIEAMRSIASPLLSIGITYFTMDRTYQDGTHLRLTTHGDWIEAYYRSELYKVAIFEKDPKLFTGGFIFWSWLNREPIYAAASEFNIDHGLTITEKNDLYADFFHFGTSVDNPIPPENIVSKLDYLYQFIAYFKQKGNFLIKEAEKNRFSLILPEKHEPLQSIVNFNNNCTSLYDLFEKTPVTRFYLSGCYENVYLTREEMKTVMLLKEGNTVPEIAAHKSISKRTIETHIEHLKEKLQCKTLFQLGVVLGSFDAMRCLPFKG